MGKDTIKIRKFTVKPGEKVNGWVPLGQMLDGSPFRVPLIVVNGQKPGPKLLVGACVHGDEVIGIEAIKSIASQLKPEKIAGTFIGMPIVNIASYMSLARVDKLETPIGGNNMHLHWQNGTSEGSMTERAAAFFRDEVLPLAEYYIDIHSSATGSYNSPRAIVAGDYVKLDPVVRKRIDVMGVACNFGVIFKPKSASWKGMYFAPRTFFEEKGIAKIVLETGAAPTLDDVETIKEGISNIMKAIKMIPGKPRVKNRQTYCSRLFAVRSNAGGIFRTGVKLGARVRKGDTLGEVTDIFDHIVEKVVAPSAGIVIKVATTAAVYTGIRLIVLAVPD